MHVMKIKPIFGWTGYAVLSLIYSVLLSAYVYLRYFSGTDHPPWLHDWVITFLLLFAGCGIGVHRTCRKFRLDASGIRRGALIILFSVPFVGSRIDAPPIEADYGVQDILPADPSVFDSYDTLMRFRKDGGIKIEPPIGGPLHFGMATNTLEHAALIRQAWENMAEARGIIEELDTFPGITDLSPHVEWSTNMPTLGFLTLRSIAQTYALYARLRTAEGYPDEGVEHLATFHRVTRKALPHASFLVSKMIWVSVAGLLSIEAAFAIMQDPHCTTNTLHLLSREFPPLPIEHVSIRNALISEYIGIKSFCETELEPGNFHEVFTRFEAGKKAETPSRLRKAAFAAFYRLAFRKNRTFRDLRRHFDHAIAGAGRHPPDMTDANAFGEAFPRHPDIRNLAGWYFVSHSMASYSRSAGVAFQTKVRSDLLAMEIGHRLNQPPALRDLYTNEVYQQDSRTGRFFSVGPDIMSPTGGHIMLGDK